ncbi:MAG TPA: YceI family protein [Solirubrobacteraceae bacterium]|nr:YceI family protein [Solirubrobacteraceae bacterium]
MTTATDQLQGTYVLDPIHSSASFAVKHMIVSTFRGRFETFDAKLVDGRLTGTVDVGSIVVKDENLAAHLQSPEFFDAERHPELRFESSEIRPDGDEVVVDGELTIKGITKAVEARGTIEGPAVTFGDVNKIGLSLEAIIDRTEFGLDWNAPLPKGGFALANDVKLIVELELAEQA